MARPRGSTNRTPAEIKRDAEIELLKAKLKEAEHKKKLEQQKKKQQQQEQEKKNGK